MLHLHVWYECTGWRESSTIKHSLTVEHSLHKPFWQLQLVFFNFRRGCVRVSLCVWLSWAGCCSLSAICSSQCVVICKTPKLQAYTQASTLSACFKTRNSLCPLWYTVSCVSGALASVPFSFVLLSNEPAEVTVSWMRRLPASQNIILIS